MDKKAKTTQSNVGKKLNKTKKEIAQLNEELEKLINSNVNRGIVRDEQNKLIVKDDHSSYTRNESNKASGLSNTIGKLNVVNPTFLKAGSSSSTEIKNNAEVSTSNKAKPYKKEAAKEYIRQQREKREEQRKQMNSKAKIDRDLKKQKLYELQQKSLLLVQKNLQMKRERSKSRENRQEVRIDRNAPASMKVNLYNRKPINGLFTNTKENSQKSGLHSCSKFVEPKILKENSSTKSELPSTGRTRIDKNIVARGPESNKKLHFSQAPFRNLTIHSESSPSNVNLLSKKDQDLAATKIQAFYRGYRLRKTLTRDLKRNSENLVRESKQTQTTLKEEIKTPEWLEVPPIDPYPCNFINTIKRKLQIAVNFPIKSRDIGVQSSFIESQRYNITNRNNMINCREENPKFSQGCPSLDADALQHLALVHSDNKSQPNNNEYLKSDSDCDTSKNIPEISTESGEESLQNKKMIAVIDDSNNFVHINADRIKNLHLKIPQDRIENTYNRNKYVLDINSVPCSSISKKSGTFQFNDDLNYSNDSFTNVQSNSHLSTKKDSNKSDSNYIPQISQYEKNGEQCSGKEVKFIHSPRDSILSFNKTFESYVNNSNNIKSIHTETESDSSRKEILVPSPRDSIISFNKSDFSKKVPIKSRQKDSTSTSEIKTEKIAQNKMNVAPSVNRSIQNKLNNISKTSKSFTHEETSSLDIIKTIEDSINTSLTSHISGISDTSHLSSYHSKRSENIKRQEMFPKKFDSPLRSDETSSANNSNHRRKKLDFNSIPESISKRGINQSTLNTSSSLNSSHISSKNSKIEENHKNNLKNMPPSGIENSNSDKSTELHTEISVQKSDGSKRNEPNNTQYMSFYSSNFSSEKSSSLVAREPQDFFVVCKDQEVNDAQSGNKNRRHNFDTTTLDEKIENDTKFVRDINSRIIHAKADVNEIHLKFEAEVHLLNDFNESLKQLMAVEKAFETIKNKNENSCRNTSKNASSVTISGESRIATELSKSASSINITRGSFSNESQRSLPKKSWKSRHTSSTQELSNFDAILDDHSKSDSNSKISNNLAGLSIQMFEQLIKDEDVRIENLKTIIKIREQALLDRTKGELAWLEIQRKHLKETGKLQEASLVKKKQRGILLKHQQERREMQRLRQLKKIQSNERKTILKEQRNLIKAKLSSEKIMSELKIHTPRKQRASGPLRVLKSSESVHSETSISRKASDSGEIVSITSKSQSIRLSEIGSFSEMLLNENDRKMAENAKDITNMKRALLVRQAALMKRRRAVEDLLQRHQKLLEEEKKIRELEMAANALIMQIPSTQPSANKIKLKSQELNELDQKGTFTKNEFSDDKIYNLTRFTHDKLQDICGNKNTHVRDSIPFENIPVNDRNNSIIEISDETQLVETIPSNSQDYTDDFGSDVRTMNSDVPDDDNLSSISELIEDFSKIEEGISMLSKQSETMESRSSEVLSQSLKESVIEAKNTVSVMPTVDSLSENIVTSQNNEILTDVDIPTRNYILDEIKDAEVTVIPEVLDSLSGDVKSAEQDSDSLKQSTSPRHVVLEDIISVPSFSYNSTYQVESPDSDCNSEKESSVVENHSEVNVSKISILSENTSKLTITELITDIQDVRSCNEKLQNEDSTQVGSVECTGSDHTEAIIAKPEENTTIIELESVKKSETIVLTESNSEVNEKTDEISYNISLEQSIQKDTELSLKTTKDALMVLSMNDDEEFSTGEEFDGVSELFRIETNSEVTFLKTISNEVPEVLPTSIELHDLIDGNVEESSSDNYSDDFEEDREDFNIDEISGEKFSSHSVESTPNDTNSDTTKSKKENEKDAVLMVKIDLPDTQVVNEAKIVVMNERSTLSDQTLIAEENQEQEDHVVCPDAEVTMSEEDGSISSKSKVQQRVSEILANTIDSQKNLKEKTLNYQDYYVTTYEDITPTDSPESGSPTKSNQITSMNIFGNEAEELLKKQLAIEQEIKHLEQQQKDQLPFVYMREIPNKPPPPYTPPSTVNTPPSTILPSTVDDLNEICNYSAKVLYNAYLSNNLNAVTFSESHFKSINETNSTQDCCLFVFDLCREIAKSHYMRFEKENVPCWLKPTKETQLALGKPCDYSQLEKLINNKVKELFGYEKPTVKENAVIKWSRKKKDHVDEILILEFQAQEHEWLNYDKDELMVKNEVTNEILDILLHDTVAVFKKIFS